MTDPLGMQEFSIEARRSLVTGLGIRIGKALLRFYTYTPILITGALDKLGARALSDLYLSQLFDLSPYDWALGELLAERFYDKYQTKYAVGTVERGRFLLSAMRSSVPSEQLMSAYFENLSALMDDKAERPTPGQLVLGIGCGRTGSTTLAALLASARDSISTHENPPLVYWEPHPRQVSFHIRRMSVLLKYFSLVADSASWWINLLGSVRQEIPDVKIIALVRHAEDCVRSFGQTVDQNPWGGPWKTLWENRRWDLIMPHYEIPKDAIRRPNVAKRSMIRQYVTDYNLLISDIAEEYGSNLLIVRTEDLSSITTTRRITDFIGIPIFASNIHYNMGKTDDGASLSFRF